MTKPNSNDPTPAEDPRVARRARAAARANWPVKRARLDDPPNDDLSVTTTARERLDTVWTLTLEAWALAGWEIPQYERHETPIRVIRRRG